MMLICGRLGHTCIRRMGIRESSNLSGRRCQDGRQARLAAGLRLLLVILYFALQLLHELSLALLAVLYSLSPLHGIQR